MKFFDAMGKLHVTHLKISEFCGTFLIIFRTFFSPCRFNQEEVVRDNFSAHFHLKIDSLLYENIALFTG